MTKNLKVWSLALLASLGLAACGGVSGNGGSSADPASTPDASNSDTSAGYGDSSSSLPAPSEGFPVDAWNAYAAANGISDSLPALEGADSYAVLNTSDASILKFALTYGSEALASAAKTSYVGLLEQANFEDAGKDFYEDLHYRSENNQFGVCPWLNKAQLILEMQVVEDLDVDFPAADLASALSTNLNITDAVPAAGKAIGYEVIGDENGVQVKGEFNFNDEAQNAIDLYIAALLDAGFKKSRSNGSGSFYYVNAAGTLDVCPWLSLKDGFMMVIDYVPAQEGEGYTAASVAADINANFASAGVSDFLKYNSQYGIWNGGSRMAESTDESETALGGAADILASYLPEYLVVGNGIYGDPTDPSYYDLFQDESYYYYIGFSTDDEAVVGYITSYVYNGYLIGEMSVYDAEEGPAAELADWPTEDVAEFIEENFPGAQDVLPALEGYATEFDLTEYDGVPCIDVYLADGSMDGVTEAAEAYAAVLEEAGFELAGYDKNDQPIYVSPNEEYAVTIAIYYADSSYSSLMISLEFCSVEDIAVHDPTVWPAEDIEELLKDEVGENYQDTLPAYTGEFASCEAGSYMGMNYVDIEFEGISEEQANAALSLYVSILEDAGFTLVPNEDPEDDDIVYRSPNEEYDVTVSLGGNATDGFYLFVLFEAYFAPIAPSTTFPAAQLDALIPGAGSMPAINNGTNYEINIYAAGYVELYITFASEADAQACYDGYGAILVAAGYSDKQSYYLSADGSYAIQIYSIDGVVVEIDIARVG